MKKFTILATVLLGTTVLAADTPPIPDGYRYFGELPQPTEGIGTPKAGRLPVAVLTIGKKHDLVVLANGRLWYYINESKPGKILFSEPIELKDTDGNTVETQYFYSAGPDKLMIHLAADISVETQIVGEDVPQLKFAAHPVQDSSTLPAWQAIADFDGDGKQDIVIGGANATTLYSALGE